MAINIQGEVSYVGCVLSLSERNEYHDSDFFAYVWDEAENRVSRIMYGTTRGYSASYAEVDATPEIIEKAKMWREEKVLAHAQEMENAKACIPDVGKQVIVVTKRGKNKGKSGVVTKRAANPFQHYNKNGYNKPESLFNQRVQIRTEEGEYFWVDLLNTRVVGHEDADLYASNSILKVAGFKAVAYSF